MRKCGGYQYLSGYDSFYTSVERQIVDLLLFLVQSYVLKKLCTSEIYATQHLKDNHYSGEH